LEHVLIWGVFWNTNPFLLVSICDSTTTSLLSFFYLKESYLVFPRVHGCQSKEDSSSNQRKMNAFAPELELSSQGDLQSNVQNNNSNKKAVRNRTFFSIRTHNKFPRTRAQASDSAMGICEEKGRVAGQGNVTWLVMGIVGAEKRGDLVISKPYDEASEICSTGEKRERERVRSIINNLAKRKCIVKSLSIHWW
jgi:hypothetical protein